MPLNGPNNTVYLLVTNLLLRLRQEMLHMCWVGKVVAHMIVGHPSFYPINIVKHYIENNFIPSLLHEHGQYLTDMNEGPGVLTYHSS